MNNKWLYGAAIGVGLLMLAPTYTYVRKETANTWSAIQTFQAGFKRPTIQIKEVCASGCEFTTIASALAAISDASTTRRYTVIVQPGNYDENITAISYVTLQGTSRETCRLRGTGATTVTIPADVTEFNLRNITIGGNIPINFGVGGTVATNFLFDSIRMGISDGTENVGKSIDGLYSTTGVLHNITLQNSTCDSTYDCVRLGTRDTYHGSGNIFRISGNVAFINTPRAWSTGNANDNTLIETGSQAYISNSATSNAVGGLEITGSGTCTAAGAIVDLSGVDIHMVETHASRTGTTRCVYIKSAGTCSSASTVRLRNVSCDITSANTGVALAVQLDNDADLANWTVEWLGGKMLETGGGTQRDITNNVTQAGFVFNVSGVLNGGVYTGSGTTTFYQAPIAAGQVKTTAIATAPATCSIGDFYADTSGAMCYCTAANTWTNVSGVGACT